MLAVVHAGGVVVLQPASTKSRLSLLPALNSAWSRASISSRHSAFGAHRERGLLGQGRGGDRRKDEKESWKNLQGGLPIRIDTRDDRETRKLGQAAK
jgi:hypothetical protein